MPSLVNHFEIHGPKLPRFYFDDWFQLRTRFAICYPPSNLSRCCRNSLPRSMLVTRNKLQWRHWTLWSTFWHF